MNINFEDWWQKQTKFSQEDKMLVKNIWELSILLSKPSRKTCKDKSLFNHMIYPHTILFNEICNITKNIFD